MDNKKEHINFVISIVFIGLLVSGLLYTTINVFMSSDDDYTEDYYNQNGEVIEYPLFQRFSNSIYKSKSFEKLVLNVNYVLFHELPDSGIIVGNNDFLFEIENEETGYNYISDYLGETNYSGAELKKIADNIEALRADYEAKGMKFVIVAIPNSHTIYSEYMPNYIGDRSVSTSLSQLNGYLKQNGCECFYDLSSGLINNKSYGYLYNNTENSLTALGAYNVYIETMKLLENTLPMYSENKLSFYLHQTEGKSAARSAGVESIVSNRSISVSSEFVHTYRTSINSNLRITMTTSEFQNSITKNSSILLEFDSEPTLLQLMPYFSNTYSEVVYKLGFDYQSYAVTRAQANTVVRFISENNLRQLLETEEG